MLSFLALAYFEPEVYWRSCEALTRHTQNPAIVITVNSSIFRTFCNPRMYRNSAYLEWETLCNPGNWEPWHIVNSGIFRTLTYLKPGTYSEALQRFKMGCFKYFSNTLYLRCLTEFWICPFFDKYSSTFRVTLWYVLCEIFRTLYIIVN